MNDPLREPSNYSRDELQARNRAWLATNGWNAREGRLWNEAWEAARQFYTSNATEGSEP